MSAIQFHFQHSLWWILLLIALAIAIAYFMYATNNPWNKKWTFFLASLRAIAIFLIGLLLLDLSIKSIDSENIPAKVNLLLDNSSSLQLSDSSNIQPFLTKLQALENKLADAGYSTHFYAYDTKAENIPDDIQFNFPLSNIDQLIKKAEQSDGQQNVAAHVLISDGLYNQGISPLYFPYKRPIYTLAYGDSTTKKDIELIDIQHNKISYKGNRFPLIAEVASNGFDNTSATMQLWHKDKLLEERKLSFSYKGEIKVETFYVDAEIAGIMSLELRVIPADTDQIKQNNSKRVYVDVVEGKQKIAVLAAAPHPDIKALRAALEVNSNFETTVYIPGINPFKKDKYDLLILYQLPNASMLFSEEIEKMLKDGIPVLYIIGSNTSLTKINELEQLINIKDKKGKSDQVFPLANTLFKSFKLSENTSSSLNKFGPVSSPYVDYSLDANIDILLYQKLAGVNTEKPLLLFYNSSGNKKAFLLAENFWTWRLQEYATAENHQAFDEVFSKSASYLAAKEDKRRFKAFPKGEGFNDKVPIEFETELYNDLYERIDDYEVSLRLSNENDSSFSYKFAARTHQTAYSIGILPAGIYRFEARTQHDGVNYSQSGEFVIQSLNIERLRLTTDTALLRSLAAKNAGSYYYWTDVDLLAEDLIQQEFPTKILSQSSEKSLTDLWWYLLFVILLLATEWFFRKYLGSI